MCVNGLNLIKTICIVGQKFGLYQIGKLPDCFHWGPRSKDFAKLKFYMSSFSLTNTLRRTPWRKLGAKLLPRLQHLHHSKIRRCQCCDSFTVIVALDNSGEFSRCVRCGANRRYEILAKTLQREFENFECKDIFELDPDSPLRLMLSNGKSYGRSFYSASESLGTYRADGAQCQDITSLTLPDSSVDLLVSSEVLEHVADIKIATQEISRILRRGGSHVFTVPTLPKLSTICRAIIEDGTIKHLVEPEYHGDPLSTGEGILAFWTFGRDAGRLLSNSVLQTDIIFEDWSRGESGYRAVWRSVRI